jgi:hypothetical protein|tara:strand:- start:572 stop:1546 length:975 start_codon:yes stop_codon:yes gene_type:complete
MPEENKIKKEDPKVDLDTSGPEVDVTLPEEKVEKEIVTEQEPVKEETVKEVPKEEVKEEPVKEDDSKLEEYSKGVQSRIAKLTRKMREAERREAAATEYAQALELQRNKDQSTFKKMDTDYWTRFEKNVKTGMESAQKELAAAIESGNAEAQVEANKRIATLAFENAKLEQAKEGRKEQEQPVQLSDGGKLPRQTPQELPQPDPQAEAWAAKNEWFGKDRAMTFTAFEHHKDLVEKEGMDPKDPTYYTEIDKRIRVDFPQKFVKGGDVEQTSKTNQLVASAQRSVKPGRQTVRLTSSQVAIAKKLGVPLEEYAKQLKLTKEASI